MGPVRWVPLLALALAACEGEAQRPAEEPRAPPADVASAPVAAASAPAVSAEASDSAAITDIAALVGEYRVAGADGQGIDLPHGISARITSEGIHVASDCVNLSWSWFFEGSRLVTEQLFPRGSCGRELLPEEQAIVAAMNGATGIGRTRENGIEIGGENGSVLLFSQ